MSSRHQTGNSVTLFPFLAVLVCAMGALIFLLLVTTRRIRQQTLAEMQTAVVVEEEPAPEAASQPALQAAPTLAVVEEPPVLEPAPSAVAAANDPRDDEPLLPALAPDPVPEETGPSPEELRLARLQEWEELRQQRDDELAQLQADWEERVRELTARRDRLARELRAAESAIAAQSKRLDTVRQTVAAMDDQRSTIAQQWDQLRQSRSALIEERVRLSREIDQAERELRRMQARQAAASHRFRIVPYDGQSGTTRRPIVIECRPDGLVFASEEITLTAEDLSGFPPSRNPLLAGAEALFRYWSMKASLDSDADKPYILLVVRPEGTVAYYVARKLLEPLDAVVGYELVEDDQEFEWPESDPAAEALCREAIDQLLDQRRVLARRLSDGRYPIAGPLNFASREGEFQLDEVEQLRSRDSDRGVYIGNRRFSRDLDTARRPPGGDPTETEREFAAASRGTPLQPSAPQRRVGNSSEPPASRAEPGVFRQPIAARAMSRSSRSFSKPTERTGTSSAPPASESQQATSGSPRLSHGGKPKVDPKNPQWGIRPPGSVIGYERSVTIRVTPSEVAIAEGAKIPITSGIAGEDLQQSLADALDAHVRDWGPPPEGFFWQPAVRFVVSPGGNQYHERLHSVVQGWSLRTSVEYVLD
ncbi:hypothetical protein Mal4_59050 [Maioricimonas rarisocia]|uniref:Uncharacterized protein n=1 Tax=Maioricimonas rarisocia TaxID=2528026 RepID=A0A517ZGC4_9PLAN|nr:cell envelope integrity protein TolA [Maioricimonas rarisocia]QDU41537.1 hypothetical protein Mal4_59050 [Maioricimonas rarisocia]